MSFKTSENTTKLYTALVDAQAGMPIARKSAQSRFHRYATLDDLKIAALPCLTNHGLRVQQGPTWMEGQLFITTRIIHKPSGEYIEGCMPAFPIPLVKNDIQAFGSQLSYVERYSYKMMVGIITDDEDDDGERSMNFSSYEKPQTITKEQIEQLDYELSDHPDIKNKLLSALNIIKLESMPKDKFFNSLSRIRKIKSDMSSTKS